MNAFLLHFYICEVGGVFFNIFKYKTRLKSLYTARQQTRTIVSKVFELKIITNENKSKGICSDMQNKNIYSKIKIPVVGAFVSQSLHMILCSR